MRLWILDETSNRKGATVMIECADPKNIGCGWVGEPDETNAGHCPKCGGTDFDDLDDEEE